jgi:hypothetical protein
MAAKCKTSSENRIFMKTKLFAGMIAASALLGAGQLVCFGAPQGTAVIDRIEQEQPGGVIYGGDTLSGVTTETGIGGEFTIIPSDSSLLSRYAASTIVTDPDAPVTGQQGFQSFCLELNVGYPTLIPPPESALSYTISSNVINNSSLVVTLGTAWLYSQFSKGVLSGYAYSGAAGSFGGTGWSSPRADSAAYLQAAIWYLEGEITLSAAGAATNPYLNLLTASTGSGGLGLSSLSAATAANNGAYNVLVMNFGDNPNTSGSYQYQAQLVMGGPTSSTPDSGATVALLGASLAGFAMLRKKLGL